MVTELEKIRENSRNRRSMNFSQFELDKRICLL